MGENLKNDPTLKTQAITFTSKTCIVNIILNLSPSRIVFNSLSEFPECEYSYYTTLQKTLQRDKIRNSWLT